MIVDPVQEAMQSPVYVLSPTRAWKQSEGGAHVSLEAPPDRSATTKPPNSPTVAARTVISVNTRKCEFRVSFVTVDSG